jgi:sugar lactone lactonase YvrE
LDEIDGSPINGINEMVPDGTGGIYFGTIDLEMVLMGRPTRPTSIHRLTVAGDVLQVAEAIGFTNGIMYDPGRKRFYCNDTFHCTWAFDVEDDLALTNRRVLTDKEDADGMAIDAEGNLWITGFRSSYLTRLGPDGTRLSDVRMPAGSITQVRFGGADGRDCYVTSVPAEAGDTLKDGGVLTETTSFLYRGRSEVPGMLVEPARFKVS